MGESGFGSAWRGLEVGRFRIDGGLAYLLQGW